MPSKYFFSSTLCRGTGPASAPTIVFLHGGGGGGWMWQPQLDGLPDYHCLVPDLPEHGKSMAVKPLTIQGAADTHRRVDPYSSSRRAGAYRRAFTRARRSEWRCLSLAPELVDHAVISSALVRPIPGGGLLTPGLVGISYRMSVPPFKHNDWWIRLNMKYSAGIPDQYFPQFKEVFQNMTEELICAPDGRKSRFPSPGRVGAGHLAGVGGGGAEGIQSHAPVGA